MLFPTMLVGSFHTSAGSGTDGVARALADVVRRDNLLPQPFD